MSFIAVVRAIPVAVRVLIAGGGAYGTVKVGVWNDSEQSREKLKDIHHSWKDAITIHPSSVPEAKYKEVSPVTSATKSWNGAVQNFFSYFIGTSDRRSQAGQFVASKLEELRKWAGNK